MSRLFDDATPDYMSRTAVITAAPFTQCGWFRTNDNVDDTQPCFGHEQSGTDNFFKARFEMTSTQFSFRAEQTTPSRALATNSTVAPVVNTWHHVAAVSTSSTLIAVFLDGGAKDTDTTPATVPDSIDTSTIARLDDGSAQHLSGNGAHVAIWDVALSDSEIATLATGVSPLRVRRANLIHYWPCNGDQSPEADIIGGASMTITGSPAKDFEPPIPYSIVTP
jgi:hypothetical protein